MNVGRILAVAGKEWREIVRDRLFFLMAFLLPPALLVVVSYGLSFDVEHIPFAVLDHDRSALSRDYLHRFMDSRYFDYRGDARDLRQLDRLLATSRIRFALVIPPRFQERLLAGRPVAVQSLIDGVFPYRAQVSKGYVEAVSADFSAGLIARHLAARRGLPPAQAQALAVPVRLEIRYLYNQALRSFWSVPTGQIMMTLMFVPPFLTALGVVREKESGAIYNIYASTVTRAEFLLGKLLPYAAINVFHVFLLWALVLHGFGVPFKGDPLFFALASGVYVVCTAGIGLLVSLLVRTQAAAALLTMVVSFVPALLYSGLIVPVESMGRSAWIEAHLFPAYYYLRIVWGSFLKGLGWRALWPDLAALALYAAVLWGLGWLLFRKRSRR